MRLPVLLIAATAALPAAALPAAAQGAPDPVLERLNRLEAEVAALKAKNAELEAKLGAAKSGADAGASSQAQRLVEWSGAAPTFNDPSGAISLHPRGTVEVEGAAYLGGAGGYQYNSGTGFRRARFGFDGKLLRIIDWRFETEVAGNQVQILDAYFTTHFSPHLELTLGQQRIPVSLDQMNAQVNQIFLERSMFVNAFVGPSAGRRIGASAVYGTPQLQLTASFFGENESTVRSNTAPGEGYGAALRATWEPVNGKGRLLHLGASGFWRTDQRAGDVPASVRFSDRPNSRVDGGLIADSGVVTGVSDVYYWSAEAAGILGPVYLQGEYGRLYLDRPGLPDIRYSGFYVAGAWVLTGEEHSFRRHSLDKLRPRHPLDPRKGQWGAVELVARYDSINLGQSPGTRAGNRAETVTAGADWWLNPNARVMFGWIHFTGRNTPLDTVGDRTRGDALQTRLHLDF